MTQRPEPPPALTGSGGVDGTTDDEGGKPLPLPLALPAGSTAFDPRATHPIGGPVEPRRASHRALRIATGIALAFAAAAACGAVWLVPWYIRTQCVLVAAAHGITLSIEEAHLDGDGFYLLGVRASASAVPGVSARARRVDVVTRRLRPERTFLSGVDVTVSSRWGELASALSRWRATAPDHDADAWAPSSLQLDDARVTWQPTGQRVRADATGVDATIAWTGDDVELHARSERVMTTLPAGTLGPWGVDVDRTADASRVRVALDPGVPDACTVLVVGDAERTTSVDVVIPRSPVAHLGFPPELVGPGARDAQLAADVHYVALGPSRADVKATGGLYGARLSGVPAPVDVSWDGSASGDPTSGIEFRHARLAVGPLEGPVSGTLRTFDDGFRLALAWTGGPVPCAAFFAPPPASSGLGLQAAIGQLVGAVASSALAGQVSVNARASIDSRDPGGATVDVRPELTCRGLR